MSRLHTAILAGGIGSGKSTVARELERLGCRRIDLDQLSRDVLAPGTQTTHEVAEAFGVDLLDQATGELDRSLLAQRAFVSRESAALLERIELPAIRTLLQQRLAELSLRQEAPAVCLVEVPLLDRLDQPHDLADEVVVVSCPLDLRRQRAIGRGMTPEGFDARVANQPDDAWLVAQADTVIDNAGSQDQLLAQVRTWFDQRMAALEES